MLSGHKPFQWEETVGMIPSGRSFYTLFGISSVEISGRMWISSEQAVAAETVFLRSYCRSCTSPYLPYLMLPTTLCQLCFTGIRTSGLSMGFPGGMEGKESACNVGDLGSVPGLGRSPGEENGNPLNSHSCLGESYGQRSLLGYSPWGNRESGTTEWVALSQPPFRGLTESRFRHRYPDYKYSFWSR